MRIALALPLILACGLAAPALAQPADSHIQTVSTAAPAAKAESSQPQAQSKAHEQDEQAAAALAMSIRQRETEERRIAQIACAAGDTRKCQAANAATTPSTSAP